MSEEPKPSKFIGDSEEAKAIVALNKKIQAEFLKKQQQNKPKPPDTSKKG